MVIGVNCFEGLWFFNVVVFIGFDGEVYVIYDKYYFVFFGEYLLFGDFFVWFGYYGMVCSEGYGFLFGVGVEVMDFGFFGLVLLLICYEVVFL